MASLIFLDLPWIDPMPIIGQPINYNFSIQVASNSLKSILYFKKHAGFRYCIINCTYKVLDVFGTPLPNKTVYANISPNPQLLHLFPNYGLYHTFFHSLFVHFCFYFVCYCMLMSSSRNVGKQRFYFRRFWGG